MHQDAPTGFDDWHAIQSLLMTYAELVDAGRFAEAAALFEHATYRTEHDVDGRSETTTCRGTPQVLEHMNRTRLFADGTPRTKHVTTNVIIEVDGDTATSRCYVTVLQQAPEHPLLPVAAGRHLDTFERVDGMWRFVDRLRTGFLVGDVSRHTTSPATDDRSARGGSS